MTLFKTLGGEAKEQFSTGAQRGTEEGKIKFHAIPVSNLVRFAKYFGGGIAYFNTDHTAPALTGFCPVEETNISLIPDIMLNRVAGLYWRGAFKYGESNWTRGIPLLRVYGSLFRHLIMWFAGDTTEDHLAAVIWNATTLMWTENEINQGHLPASLANAGPLKYEESKRKAT